MKNRLLLLIAIALLTTSCASSYYNVTKKNATLSDSAIICTHSKGVRTGDTYEVVFESINDEKLLGKSKRWLYMKPGEYKIGISGYAYNAAAYCAGAIAGGGSSAAIAVSSSTASAKMENTIFKGNMIKAKLEAGRIYVIEPHIKDKRIEYIELKSY